MARKIAGTVYLQVDGQTYTLGDSCTTSLSGVERAGVVGMSGKVVFTESPRVPFIEVQLLNTPELDLDELEAVTDATVKVEGANGRDYVLRHAFTCPPFDVNHKDGTVTVRLEGEV